MEQFDWESYCQLIQDLAGGTVRRNKFTRCEMELLLDAQMAHIRRSSRPDVLRRYLRTTQQQQSSGAHLPQRFSRFVEAEAQSRMAVSRPDPALVLPRAS